LGNGEPRHHAVMKKSSKLVAKERTTNSSDCQGERYTSRRRRVVGELADKRYQADGNRGARPSKEGTRRSLIRGERGVRNGLERSQNQWLSGEEHGNLSQISLVKGV